MLVIVVVGGDGGGGVLPGAQLWADPLLTYHGYSMS